MTTKRDPVLDGLELAIDERTLELRQDLLAWEGFADLPAATQAVISAYVRSAYGKGYTDALTDGGSLHEELGFERPQRRKVGT